MWFIALYILFWIAMMIGSVVMIIWAITNRIKEKKIEEVKHKHYKNY